MPRWPDWLGLSEKRWQKAENEEIRPAKTAWDWLQLLVVPIVLAVLAIAFNSWQSSREAEREAARADREREFAERTRLDDTLQVYFAQMSELVLDRKLLSAASRSDVQVLARTLTLTTLQRLDGTRKRELLQFLIESNLIRVGSPKVALVDADLGGADLARLDLDGIDLSYTKLFGAQFAGAVLTDVNLDGAEMSHASFERASLNRVSFRGARLIEASFKHACLYKVRLIAADLSRATFAYTRGDRIDSREAALGDTSWTDAEFTNSQFALSRGARPRGWEPSSNDPRPSASLDVDGDGLGCER